MKCVLFLFVLTADFYATNAESCITFDGSKGNCIQLLKCPALLSLVKSSESLSSEDVQLLKNSTCGLEGKMPKVCCPYMCLTSSGEQGKCVGGDSCSELCSDYCEVTRCEGRGTDTICDPVDSSNQAITYSCPARVSAYPPNSNSKCCGVDTTVDSIIVNGSDEAELDAYPWMVLIEYQTDNLIIKTPCGGVLISGKYVLTAAHCVVGLPERIGHPVSIRLGEHDTTTDVDCKMIDGFEFCKDRAVSILIEEIIPHYEYDKKSQKHDIALIRMKEFAPYTDFIRPICLPTEDVTLGGPEIIFDVAGWGQVNHTRVRSPFKVHGQVSFVDQKTCQNAFNRHTPIPEIGKGQICAGGEIGKNTCKGHGGAPLMHQSSRTYHVTGINSYSNRFCNTAPVVYTKVFDYIDWIYCNIVP